jgi:hypothetical protein
MIVQQATEGKILTFDGGFAHKVFRPDNSQEWEEVDDIGQLDIVVEDGM